MPNVYIYIHWPPIFGHRSLKTFRPAMARCSMLSVLLLHIIEMHLGPLAIEWWGIMWQHLVWSGLTCSMIFLPWNSETEFNRSNDSPRHSKTKKLRIPKLPSYSCNLLDRLSITHTANTAHKLLASPLRHWKSPGLCPLCCLRSFHFSQVWPFCRLNLVSGVVMWLMIILISPLYVVIHIFLSSKRKGDMQTFGIVSTSSWAALMSSSFLGPSTAPIEDRLGFLERALKLPKSCIQRCVIIVI